jgi:hypothetical protein
MPHPRLKAKPHYTSLFAFGLSFILTATTACAQAGGKNYFPLADGAKWVYKGRFSSASGREFSVGATARVDGETLINSKRYFKFVTISDFSGVPEINKRVEDVRYYRPAEDGIYFRPGNALDKPDLLELPLPIPIGIKWLSGTTEVQAERAGTVHVGGHDYADCLKVTFRVADGARSTENYYAPGVGVIKIVYVNTTEPKSVIELMLEKHEQ